MSVIIFYVGLGIFIVGGIGFLIAAFRTSILWGLGVLLLAPVSLFYLVIHWQTAKGPFKMQIFGLVIILLAVFVDGGLGFSSSIKTTTLSSSSLPSSVMLGKQFQCDGRQYCSQMNSRAEAEFFLRNCPGAKMDGDIDGVPCENDSRF